VLTGILLYVYWLKLYKYKNWVRVKNGAEKPKKLKNHWELVEFRAGSFVLHKTQRGWRTWR